MTRNLAKKLTAPSGSWLHSLIFSKDAEDLSSRQERHQSLPALLDLE